MYFCLSVKLLRCSLNLFKSLGLIILWNWLITIILSKQLLSLMLFFSRQLCISLLRLFNTYFLSGVSICNKIVILLSFGFRFRLLNRFFSSRARNSSRAVLILNARDMAIKLSKDIICKVRLNKKNG